MGTFQQLIRTSEENNSNGMDQPRTCCDVIDISKYISYEYKKHFMNVNKEAE